MKINYKIFSIHNYYLLSCSIYILLYIFITPPFYVADEYAHFQKSSSNENIYLRGPLNIDSGIKRFADDFEYKAYKKWKVDRDIKYSKNFIKENVDNYKLQYSLMPSNLASLTGYPVTGYLVSKTINNITKKITCPARPPVINILIDMLIAKKLYKENTKFEIFLLKNI